MQLAIRNYWDNISININMIDKIEMLFVFTKIFNQSLRQYDVLSSEK